MICGGCDREIPDRPAEGEGCGGCGGSCRKVHCPWCGYENPVLPGYLQRLTNNKTNDQLKE